MILILGGSFFRLNYRLRMEEGTILDKKGRKIKTFTWRPRDDVRGLVFLSHGSVFDVEFNIYA